ncbi:MAG: hypothetical protein M3Y91_16770, partial [Actinomycetota bacterium]|nr:hypothetical protein [Actinomycetota bacterium]
MTPASQAPDSRRPLPVTGVDDPRLTGYGALADRPTRQRIEADLGVFVAEGLLALERLVASDYTLESVLVASNRLPRVAPLLLGCSAPVYVAESS